MTLTFSQPILHGANRLHTEAPPPCLRPPHPPGISIKKLNIQDGHVFGLVQSIQAVERGGFDVMLLTETNIYMEKYSHNHLGYDRTCSGALPSRARGDQGGVGLETRERPDGWGI